MREITSIICLLASLKFNFQHATKPYDIKACGLLNFETETSPQTRSIGGFQVAFRKKWGNSNYLSSLYMSRHRSNVVIVRLWKNLFIPNKIGYSKYNMATSLPFTQQMLYNRLNTASHQAVCLLLRHSLWNARPHQQYTVLKTLAPIGWGYEPLGDVQGLSGWIGMWTWSRFSCRAWYSSSQSGRTARCPVQ